VRARAIAALALAMIAAPSTGRAEGWRGGGSLALDLRYSEMTPDAGDPVRAVTAGPRVRAAAGKSALALAAGLDLHMGATGDGDFAYEVLVLPLGFALQIGRSARLGAVTGAGTSGVTGGALPVALALPVEAFAEVSLGDHLRAAAWGRATEVAGADRREDSAENAPFGDEIEIGATLRWDRRREDWRYVAGNGYQIGALYGQVAGAHIVGVVVGYSLDAAGSE